MAKALIIGAGPAGLMAAEVLSMAGVKVVVADAMPSVGRKFLMAGKSGLNLTKIEPQFETAFGPLPKAFATALAEFGPQDIIDWAKGLGQTTFVGSTGRVFPKAMKASPLLRSWMSRLSQQGVEFLMKWRAVSLGDRHVVFETPDGTSDISYDVLILTMGGASWARLGADGDWINWVPAKVAEFKPANVGFVVEWSAHMGPYFATPIKGTELKAGKIKSRGEWVISTQGIEGGGIYSLSAALREGANLFADLCPDFSIDEVNERLSQPRGKNSLHNHLRKKLKLNAAKIALLNEFGRPFPLELAPLIKQLPIRHLGPRPLDQAISVAGGILFSELDNRLMLRQKKGVFCAGEMLDWEAPTGGYLLTGCFATGRYAAKGALEFLSI